MARERRRAALVETLTPDALVLAQVVELAEGDLQRVVWLSPVDAVVFNSRRQRRALADELVLAREPEHEPKATDPALLPPELRWA